VTLVRGYHAVNNINPGPVDTDLNPATSAFAKILLDKVMALPRYATGDEIAFITGASLSIDGGFTA
jgi:3-oxoacyl-[acyl-carrier protein] reductase